MTRENIISLARSVSNAQGSDATPDLVGENQIVAFYHAAQAEAPRNARVQVPTETETMEQEFSHYHRLGYNKGMAEAFEAAAKLCEHEYMPRLAGRIREMAKGMK